MEDVSEEVGEEGVAGFGCTAGHGGHVRDDDLAAREVRRGDDARLDGFGEGREGRVGEDGFGEAGRGGEHGGEEGVQGGVGLGKAVHVVEGRGGVKA